MSCLLHTVGCRYRTLLQTSSTCIRPLVFLTPGSFFGLEAGQAQSLWAWRRQPNSVVQDLGLVLPKKMVKHMVCGVWRMWEFNKEGATKEESTGEEGRREEKSGVRWKRKRSTEGSRAWKSKHTGVPVPGAGWEALAEEECWGRGRCKYSELFRWGWSERKTEPRAKTINASLEGCCRGSPRIWRSEGKFEDKQNIAESGSLPPRIH